MRHARVGPPAALVGIECRLGIEHRISLITERMGESDLSGLHGWVFHGLRRGRGRHFLGARSIRRRRGFLFRRRSGGGCHGRFIFRRDDNGAQQGNHKTKLRRGLRLQQINRQGVHLQGREFRHARRHWRIQGENRVMRHRALRHDIDDAVRGFLRDEIGLSRRLHAAWFQR